MKKTLIYFLMSLYMIHELPYMGFRFPSVIFAGIIVLLFFLLYEKLGFKKIRQIAIIFIIPILDILIQPSLYIALQEVSYTMQLMLYPMMATYLIKQEDYKGIIYFLSLFVLFNIVTCITTHFGNIIYPNASRHLVTGLEEYAHMISIYRTLNIGGFGFVYSTVMLMPILFYILKYRKSFFVIYVNRIWAMIIAISYIAIIWMMLVSAAYTIAMVLAFCAMFVYFVGKKFNLKRLFIISSFLLAFYALLKDIFIDIINSIADNMANDYSANRVRDIALTLEGKEMESSRSELYLRSFETFLSNPFGIWTNDRRLGGHSFLTDNMGKYGLVGVVCLCVMFWKLFKNYIYIYKDSILYGIALVIFIMFMTTIVVNPHLCISAFLFVLPLVGCLWNRKIAEQ